MAAPERTTDLQYLKLIPAHDIPHGSHRTRLIRFGFWITCGMWERRGRESSAWSVTEKS